MQYFPLFETLCIEKGRWQNLDYHQARINRSLKEYYGCCFPFISLEKIIHMHNTLLSLDNNTLFRCRLDYNNQDYHIQIFPYVRKEYKNFQPVICNNIDYHLKYNNRQLLNELLKQKGNCDEIMIIKDGYVTDCSIGNLLFRNGDVWFTPNTPLLKGTQREKLLAEKKIIETTILLKDLQKFSEIRLINALNPFDI